MAHTVGVGVCLCEGRWLVVQVVCNWHVPTHKLRVWVLGVGLQGSHANANWQFGEVGRCLDSLSLFLSLSANVAFLYLYLMKVSEILIEMHQLQIKQNAKPKK